MNEHLCAPSYLQDRFKELDKRGWGGAPCRVFVKTIGSFSSAESFEKDRFIAACYINHTEEARKLAKGTPAWAHLVRQLGVSE